MKHAPGFLVTLNAEHVDGIVLSADASGSLDFLERATDQ